MREFCSDGQSAVQPDSQIDPLREIIRCYEAEEIDRISAETKAQTDKIVSDARKRAHAKVLAALSEERMVTEKKALAARSRFLKELMAAQHKEVSSLLGNARLMVGEELCQAWCSSSRRVAWLASALDLAFGMLIDRKWEVEVAVGVTEDELREIREICKKTGAEIVAIDQSAGLRAGVKFKSTCKGCPAQVDASVDGLLSDSSKIDSHLLFMLGREG